MAQLNSTIYLLVKGFVKFEIRCFLLYVVDSSCMTPKYGIYPSLAKGEKISQ